MRLLLSRALAGRGAALPLALVSWTLAIVLLIVDALDSARAGGPLGVLVAALLFANGAARLWFRQRFQERGRS